MFTTDIHKKTDFRIDIYKNELYEKTIIGDFKYRVYESLGTYKNYGYGRPSDAVYKQLLDYSRITSNLIRTNKKRSRTDAAAYETWAFYPSVTEAKGRSGWDTAANIRRLELSPTKDHTELISNLERVFKEILEE